MPAGRHKREDFQTRDPGLSAWGIVAIAVMLGLLAGACWYAVSVWNETAGVKVSALGWVFMAFGIIAAFALAGVLMTLIFYSSRHDMDR